MPVRLPFMSSISSVRPTSPSSVSEAHAESPEGLSRRPGYGGDAPVLIAQAATSLASPSPSQGQADRLPDITFRFFNGASGETVSVRQPIWKDNNWNFFRGYFTLVNGRRHDIDVWSPNAARGERGHEEVLKLLQQGQIDPRNITVTRTHQLAWGGDGRQHWVPMARGSREDGVTMFYALKKAQLSTDGKDWMRHGDTTAFRKGFLAARRGEAFINANAVFQAGLGIASRAAKIKSRHAERGSFDVVNRGTGQRLHVSGNKRTGGIDGTLYDRHGVPLAQQSIVGKDYRQTVTVTAGGGKGSRSPDRTAASNSITTSGTAAITTQAAQMPKSISDRPRSLSPAGAGITPSVKTPTEGTQGTATALQPTPPAYEDRPLLLTHGQQQFSVTLRKSTAQGTTPEFLVHYRIGGRDHAYLVPQADNALKAQQRVQRALLEGGLPGISSRNSHPLTLQVGGQQSHRVQIEELKIGLKRSYSLFYRIHGQNHRYTLPKEVTNLEQANTQVSQAYREGGLAGLPKPGAVPAPSLLVVAKNGVPVAAKTSQSVNPHRLLLSVDPNSSEAQEFARDAGFSKLPIELLNRKLNPHNPEPARLFVGTGDAPLTPGSKPAPSFDAKNKLFEEAPRSLRQNDIKQALIKAARQGQVQMDDATANRLTWKVSNSEDPAALKSKLEKLLLAGVPAKKVAYVFEQAPKGWEIYVSTRTADDPAAVDEALFDIQTLQSGISARNLSQADGLSAADVLAVVKTKPGDGQRRVPLKEMIQLLNSEQLPNAGLAAALHELRSVHGTVDRALRAGAAHQTVTRSAGFPARLDELFFVRRLGGQTGAQLMANAQGHQFVLKRGADPAHLRSEYAAERIYQAAGITVPQSSLYETEQGPVKLSKYIEGQTIDTALSNTDSAQVKAIHRKFRQGFLVDALLNNWDSLGALDLDNSILSQTGEVIRIDFGAALNFSAGGGKEPFGPEVHELRTFRDPAYYPVLANMYKGLTQKELLGQAQSLRAHSQQILDATPPELREVMAARIDFILDRVDR